VNREPSIVLDPRRVDELAAALRAVARGAVPEWQPGGSGAGAALVEIGARYLQAIVTRLNEVPFKQRLALLEAFGIELIPAQAARVPIVFTLSDTAADVRAPAGTRVAAPPPVDRTDQLVFETERSTGLAKAKLKEVFSLWPGRDQYIDHSTAVAEGKPITLFRLHDLQNVPHAIYIAHDTLLALAGQSRVGVGFELTTVASNGLDLLWEYWDGTVWRPFRHMRPTCGEDAAKLDSTAGLTRSGTFQLETDCAETKKTSVNGIEAFWVRGRLDETLPPNPGRVLPEVDRITLTTEIVRNGLQPEKAFFGETEVDVTKAFYPFGQQPQPGVTFAFRSDEILSKPDADVTVEATLTFGPEIIALLVLVLQPNAVGFAALHPTVGWQYWNGFEWTTLNVTPPADDPFAANLIVNRTLKVNFRVPLDLAATKVNDEEGLWVRVRFESGGYGAIVGLDGGPVFAFTVPPIFADFRLDYVWQHGPFVAEHVLTYNDFQYADHSEEAKWPGQTFRPFTYVADPTPAMYLGFSDPLPVDRVGLFFDVVEQPDDTAGPALRWEYWNGGEWDELSVEDDTRRLRVPGLVALIGPNDSQRLARFDVPLHWVRARLAEDGPPGEPTLNAIFPNAVWAVQYQTVVDEPLGASTGQASQVFAFRQIPVLAGTRVEVREVQGRRAAVEWRLIARELFGNDAGVLASIEEQLAADGTPSDVEYRNLRLHRDRTKRVTEVWVAWHEQPSLLLSGAADRDYAIEPARGRIMFGDGERGRIPPAGAALLARRYRSGGGRVGNVAARTIAQLLGPVGGVESVVNPIAAQGGADTEPYAAVGLRGPASVRHRGRAVTCADYETMAREAAADIGFARAIPCRDPGGHHVPGWVTLLIIPQSDEPQPRPSFGLRENVRRYLEASAPADVAAAARIHVTGPRYLPVDVEATLVPRDPAEAGAVVANVQQALLRFLNPVRGGPAGRGWELGRDVFLSDVAAVVERVDGLDHVEALALFAKNMRAGERLAVPDDVVVVAGELRLKAVAE
jgi:hypothetical protein